MKFIFSLLGFVVGGLLGYPLTQVSLTLTAFVTGFGCLVGFEIGTRLRARQVDPDVRALVTPTPTTYGWIMGTACGAIPVLVFVIGLTDGVRVPDIGVWVYVSFLFGPLCVGKTNGVGPPRAKFEEGAGRVLVAVPGVTEGRRQAGG